MYQTIRPIFALIALASISPLAIGASSATLAAESATQAAPLPRLDGIMKVGSVSYASFNGINQGWKRENDFVAGYVVSKIGSDYVTVADAKTQKESTLHLETAHTGDGNDTAPKYSAEWIDSTSNPMLAAPMPLPMDVRRKWKMLSDAERNQIIEEYRKHGWRIVFIDKSWGGFSFVWANEKSSEHIDAVAREQASFATALSADQRALWQKLEANPLFQGDPVSVTPTQRVAIEQRAEDSDRLRETLNPDQARQFDLLSSFHGPVGSN